MEFKQLRSFVSVVKYQSFTKAAEKTFISQPTISTHVRALEEELKTQLIIRNTKNIELTQKGWELYETAKSIINLEDKLIRKWTDETLNIIHVGASSIPSAYLLPQMIPAFMQLHPETRFNITQSDSANILDGLSSGLYDVGIVGMTSGDETISCTPFCQDRMVLVTPNNEKFRKLSESEVFPLELLSREPLILREDGSASGKCAERILEEMGIPSDGANICASLNDLESIKNLVAAGLGISVISDRAVADEVASGRILQFALNGESRRDFYVAVRKSAPPAAVVQRFIAFVKELYQYGQE